MKTNIKHFAAAGFLALTIAACKKDDKDAPPTPPANRTAVAIGSVKSKYVNAAVTLDNNIMIKGIVISDLDNGNIEANKIVIQEGNDKRGIIIKLKADTHSFKPGDVVEVGVSRQKLDMLNGELAIVDLATDSIKKTGRDTILPRTATAKQVLDSAAAWSGTLVTINNGLFDPGNEIFSGTVDYTDATGTVKSTTLNGASFRIRPIPYHEAKLTGIVRKHEETVSVDMRSWYITFFDVADYQPAYTITEDFQQWTATSSTTATMRTGIWNCLSMMAYAKSAIQDGSYSTRNRILRGNTTGAYITIPRLKGLKSVTVVFSGSVTDTVYGGNSQETEALPFNASRDDVGVNLTIISYGGLIQGIPYTIKELGKFHTVTFLVKKEDLATMDIDLDSNERLSIRNASSPTRRSKATAIVIDKVILGFDQKDPGIDPTLWDNK